MNLSRVISLEVIQDHKCRHLHIIPAVTSLLLTTNVQSGLFDITHLYTNIVFEFWLLISCIS